MHSLIAPLASVPPLLLHRGHERVLGSGGRDVRTARDDTRSLSPKLAFAPNGICASLVTDLPRCERSRSYEVVHRLHGEITLAVVAVEECLHVGVVLPQLVDLLHHRPAIRL